MLDFRIALDPTGITHDSLFVFIVFRWACPYIPMYGEMSVVLLCPLQPISHKAHDVSMAEECSAPYDECSIEI